MAQGFLQVFESGYDETFAHTAKLCTLRICFELAASWSTFVFQLDVHSALFNANLNNKLCIDNQKASRKRGLMAKHFFASFESAFMVQSKQGGNGTKQTLTLWFLKKEFVQSAEDQ